MTAELDPRLVRRLADMNAAYRMYGHTGELLYIGMTGQIRRFDSHAMKRWFPLVSRITLEWHQTEAAARLAEHRAIKAERPRYNIADTPRGRRAARTPAAPVELPTARKAGPQRDVLMDVLRVFGDRNGLPWAVLAERLAEQIPSRWSGVTKQVVSSECRALGIRSVCVSMRIDGVTRVWQGCKKDDVERMSIERLAAG